MIQGLKGGYKIQGCKFISFLNTQQTKQPKVGRTKECSREWQVVSWLLYTQLLAVYEIFSSQQLPKGKTPHFSG